MEDKKSNLSSEEDLPFDGIIDNQTNTFVDQSGFSYF